MVAEHVIERIHGTEPFLKGIFNLGAAGVYSFFLVSGFIIPFSLERTAHVGRFWVGRIFRLYPLFWFSLLIEGTLVALSQPHNPFTQGLPLSALANATMIPNLLHQPQLSGLYWTLEYELVFYAMCSVLFALRKMPKGPQALLAFSAFSFVSALLAPRFPIFGFGHGLYRSLFTFSMFFCGMFAFRYWHGLVSKKVFLRTLAIYAFSILSVALVTLRNSRADAPIDGTGLIQAAVAGAFGGAAVFFVLFALRSNTFPAGLRWLGEISYSIYLVHGLVFLLAPVIGTPVTLVAVPIVTLLLAPMTYRWIESPAIKMGRRVAERLFPKVTARQVVPSPLAQHGRGAGGEGSAPIL